MVLTVLLVLAITVVAAAVALIVDRRRPDPPSAPTFAVPRQLDRADFDGADTPWLLALFSSADCHSCQEAREVVLPLDLGGLVVQDVVHPDRADLHERYDVDAVPMVVVADAEGVVIWSYVGPPPSVAIVEIVSTLGLMPPDDGVAVDLPT